ncbi:ATP-dependent Clp protease proteolytic subunit [Streptomyces mobaraensis]|uniref:ClpP family protease n=1 Tax=Streptomyces mobaraensis TaxID=35621 RepID=UPI003318FB78
MSAYPPSAGLSPVASLASLDSATSLGSVTSLTSPSPAPAAPAAEPVFQRLLRNRIIVLGQQVDDEIANRICAEMLLLSAEDRHRDIHLYINSPGGSITAGLAIYDIMQFIPNDVATLSLGFTASMGQFLLCSGAPGKRYALPHASILMHQPSAGLAGSASDIKIQIDQMRAVKRLVQERIAHHTGQPVERIERDSDRDRYFTAQEALEYGFVDHVIASADELTGFRAVA